MAIKPEDKKVIVSEVNKAARTALSAVLADARGVTVKAMTELRREARDSNVYVRVVRNTLLKRSITDTEYDILTDSISGPTLVAFSREHPGAAARIFRDFAKKQDKFQIKSAAFEGKLISPAEISTLANLPTHAEAISQFMRVIQGVTTKLVCTLDAVRNCKESVA